MITKHNASDTFEVIKILDKFIPISL